MIKFIKSFFSKKEEVVAEVPYKVEVAPVVVALGEPPATVVVEGAGTVEVAPAKPAKAKKPAVKKQQYAKKPKAPKAPK
jgi:hypothetical protein